MVLLFFLKKNNFIDSNWKSILKIYIVKNHKRRNNIKVNNIINRYKIYKIDNLVIKISRNPIF